MMISKDSLPKEHLRIMQHIEEVIEHFTKQDDEQMYAHMIAVREYLQDLAEDRAMLFETVNRMAVNMLTAHDNR